MKTKIKRQFVIPHGNSVVGMLEFLLKCKLYSIQFYAGKITWNMWGTYLVVDFYPNNPDEYGFSEETVFSISYPDEYGFSEETVFSIFSPMKRVTTYKPGLWVAEVQALYNAKKREEAELKLQEKMEQARNFIPLGDLPTISKPWISIDDIVWVVSAIVGLIMLYALFSGEGLIAFSSVFIILVIWMRNAYAELR